MKRIFTTVSILLFSVCLIAQAPDKFSYQSVIRNANGDLLINANVGIRIQILKTDEFGAAVYVETHQAAANENGLVTLAIGDGTVVSGTFDAIDWMESPYFIKTEIDPLGGSTYTLIGTSQILSVPYALYANNSGLPENLVNTSTPPNAGDLLYFDGNGWNTVAPGDEGQVLTMINGIPAWKDPILGNEITALHDPILRIIFDDKSGNHNMHIASDGNYYYTCNGGGYNSGRINKYTLSGDSVSSFPVAIDMRGLMYNKKDGYLYASGFENNVSERNIYKITDLGNGSFQKVLPNLYDYNQASVAMSEDGEKLYAFNKGTLKVYNLSDGALADTIAGLNCGTGASGGDGTVAVDPDYIYTWNAATGMVYVYDHAGGFVRNLTLTNGNYGFSLSYVNGYLFASKDGNYSTGAWYGYNIRRNTTGTELLNKSSPVLKSNKSASGNDSTRE